MDEKATAEDSSNDLGENTEESKKIMSENRQGLSALEGNEIADQATNCINVTDESEDSLVPNPIGINEKIDFKAIFEQCSADVHEIMDEAIENINRKLTNISYSNSEGDSGKINVEDVPVASTEASEIVDQETGSMTEESKAFAKSSSVGISEIIDQETDGMTKESKDFPKASYAGFSVVMDQENDGMKEESKAFPKLSIVGFSDVMNQESSGMIEESKFFAEPSVARFSKVMDLISEEVIETTYIATTSTNITDESDVILGTNSVTDNEITDFEKNPEQCTTEVDEEIREAVGIINATTFDQSSKEDREKRNLETIFAPSKENGEIMDQAIECVNMPGTSKVATTFNAEKVDETPYPNENTAIFATESIGNLEFVNSEEKVISGPKRKTLKRKAPPIFEMLRASIKKIKRSDGVSFEDIKNHMEENYPVKVKALVKYHVSNFLQKFVDEGRLDKVDGADSERFIINEFMEI